VRTVPELVPATVIESRADMKAGRGLQKDIPLVTADDSARAGAIAFGTPTRFGNVSSQLKNQIDQLLPRCGSRANSRASRLGVFVVNGKPSRRAGDNDPDPDGPLVCTLGMILVGVALLGPGSVHHSGRRFALRAGPSGWRRQPAARDRPARGRPSAAPWVAVWQKLDCGCKRSKAATQLQTTNEDTTMTVETPTKAAPRAGQRRCAEGRCRHRTSDFYQPPPRP